MLKNEYAKAPDIEFRQPQPFVLAELAFISDRELNVKSSTTYAGEPGVYILDNDYAGAVMEINPAYNDPTSEGKLQRIIEKMQAFERFHLAFSSIPARHLGLEKTDLRSNQIYSVLARYVRKSLGERATYAPEFETEPGHQFQPHRRRLIVSIKSRFALNLSREKSGVHATKNIRTKFGLLPTIEFMADFIKIRRALYDALIAEGFSPRMIGPIEHMDLIESIFSNSPSAKWKRPGLREHNPKLFIRDQVFDYPVETEVIERTHYEDIYRFLKIDVGGDGERYAATFFVNNPSSLLPFLVAGITEPARIDMHDPKLAPLMTLTIRFSERLSDSQKITPIHYSATIAILQDAAIASGKKASIEAQAAEYIEFYKAKTPNRRIYLAPTNGELCHLLYALPMGASLAHEGTYVSLMRPCKAADIADFLPVRCSTPAHQGEIPVLSRAGEVSYHSLCISGMTLAIGLNHNSQRYLSALCPAVLAGQGKRVAVFSPQESLRLSKFDGGSRFSVDFSKPVNFSTAPNHERLAVILAAIASGSVTLDATQLQPRVRSALGDISDFEAAILAVMEDIPETKPVLSEFLTITPWFSGVGEGASCITKHPCVDHFHFDIDAVNQNPLAISLLADRLYQAASCYELVVIDTTTPEIFSAIAQYADAAKADNKNILVVSEGADALTAQSAEQVIMQWGSLSIDALYDAGVITRSEAIFLTRHNSDQRHKNKRALLIKRKDLHAHLIAPEIPRHVAYFIDEDMATHDQILNNQDFLVYLQKIGYDKTHPEMRLLSHIFSSHKILSR